jgi:aminoglycoside phosphotransferase (APT) family kinase protein
VREEGGRLQIRRKISGLSGFEVEDVIFGRPGKLTVAERYSDALVSTPSGERLASDLGRAIFGVQQAMTAQDARAFGFPETDYLEVLASVGSSLGSRAEFGALAHELSALRTWFAELPGDSVLTLRDLQMHNIAIHRASGALEGVFDFDDAAVAHRLEDFKYLPSMGKHFTTVALDAYAAAGGPRLHLAEVWRFHVFSALEHFLFVPQTSQRWHEIVAWAGAALAHQPV